MIMEPIEGASSDVGEETPTATAPDEVCGACLSGTPHHHDGDHVVFGCRPEQRTGMGSAV